ncbi:hypothetical protein [Bacillus sp. FJAT-27264]|nr:hypothetical protein [Bacillus sp. FJAT-27264]
MLNRRTRRTAVLAMRLSHHGWIARREDFLGYSGPPQPKDKS